MSSKKRQGKPTASVPSAAKVTELRQIYPDITPDVCEAILLSVDWNVERAISYLRQDSSNETKEEPEVVPDDVTYDWPALPMSPLHISSKTVQVNSGIITKVTSGSWENVSSNSGSASSPGIDSNVFKFPPTSRASISASVEREPSTAKSDDIIWKPVLRRNLKKNGDRQTLEQALEEELKHANSAKIIRLVTSKPGIKIPKIVILLRGVPGSGKSTLADIIIGVSEHGISCSADDHFINQHGKYIFNSKELPAAHSKCQFNCEKAMEESISPIVIDNTHTQSWEMAPYVKLAMKYGYEVELLEPNTSWKRNANILASRNSHSVPKNQIKRMLDRFENWTSESLKETILKDLPNGTSGLPVLKTSKVISKERTPNKTDNKVVTSLGHQKGILTAATNTAVGNGTLKNSTEPSSIYNRDFKTVCTNSPSTPFGHRTLSGSGSCCSVQDLAHGEKSHLYSEVARRNSVGSSGSDSAAINVNQLQQRANSSKVGQDEKENKQPSSIISAAGTTVWEWDNHLFDKTTANSNLSEFFFKNGPETSAEAYAANALLNLFPDLPATDLDDYLSRCNYDLSLCADLLLEGGYEMCGDLEGPRQLESFSSKKSASEKCLNQSDMENSVHAGNKNWGVEAKKAVSCTTEEFRSQSVPPGFSKRIEDESCDYAKSLEHPEDICDQGGESELFDPVDGEDWFDLQLNPEFVRQVTSAYSDLASFDVTSLPEDILKIRVPPKLAFELFQHFSIAWLQKSVDSLDREGSPDPTNGRDNEYDTDDDEIVSHVVEMEKLTSGSTPNFEKLMELEAKLAARDEKDTKAQMAAVQYNFANRLKLDKLHAGFPTLARSEIEHAFAKSNSSYEKALQSLMESQKSRFVGIRDTVVSKRKPQVLEAVPAERVKSLVSNNPTPLYVPVRNAENMTANDWRQVASQHHLLRYDYQQKMSDCLRTGGGRNGASDHFLQAIKLHTSHMQRANDKAKDMILRDHAKTNRNSDHNTLDLHHLFVTEAILALEEYLLERMKYINKKMIRKLDLRIITGVGNNSQQKQGRLGPAVIDYLKRKHLPYIQLMGTVVVTLKYMETRLYDV